MESDNLNEVNVTNSYYSEYLNIVERYQNCIRNSIFIRYYNVSVTNSDFNKITKATFDRFKNNGIYYDIYDYTPIKYINPIVETMQYQPEIAGYRLDSNSRIITYTIPDPHINDLVVFSYHPHNSEQIFRVKTFSSNIVSQLNNIKSYELDLEYAPMINVDDIKITKGNEFVYSVATERNITSKQYTDSLAWIKTVEQLFNDEFEFNPYYELYRWKDSANLSNLPANVEVYPININNLIYKILATQVNFHRFFENLPRPYGIKQYADIDTISDPNGQFSVVYDYNDPININTLLTVPIKTISDSIPISLNSAYTTLVEYYKIS